MRKIFKLFFIFFLLLFIYLCIKKYCLNSGLSTDNDKVYNYYKCDDIVDTCENDSEIIEKEFSNGMSIDDINNLCSSNYKKISSVGNYNDITYNFEKKLHYSEIEKFILEISKHNIVNSYIIGKSVDNRNIYGIEIGKGKNILFIDANIHSAEVANTLFLIKFIIDILREYDSNNNDIYKILNEIKIVIVPSINPDGYEVYNFGIESLNNKKLWLYENKDDINFNNFKFNANGIDLNRNFPTQNAGLYYKSKKLIKSVSLKKTTSTGTYFGGKYLGSEPETKAIMSYMLMHYKSVFAYINMHSQGRVIYAGKPNLSKEFNNLSKELASKISNINNYIVFGLDSEEVGEGNDGSATDFMAELANGLKFSSKTGKLSSNSYIHPNVSLKNKFSVLTLETLDTYTSNPSYFKEEYYDYKLKDVLYSLLSFSS